MSITARPIVNNEGIPATLGRFQIVSRLGKGAQGVVYLAHDPELDRQVAIKTLGKRRGNHSQLTQEARNVSKLEHLNIIPIYEIGVHEGTPYLVYQFCEGESLRNILKDNGRMKALEAVNITRQLLDAMGYAHRSGIVHRDLNPSNIMIDKDNVPRIMDFGISIMVDTESNTKDIVGTVNYMAPEQIAAGVLAPSVDIFAIGLVLYEMLTAHQVYSADNSMAVMFKITNENVLPPSSRESSIESKLDAVVMQALEKDVEKRFENAALMKAALDLYAQPSQANTSAVEAGSGNLGTVDFLLRRMQRKQDFPAISTNITQITRRSSSDTGSSASELANIILKDYALTTKLLKLVNASYYGQFGNEITTISRAVIILGFEQVRAAALSIILFEHLQNNSQAKELKNAACGALMSGIISREQACQMNHLDEESVETAFIASMFHKLGRQLTIYYFPEEYQEIKGLINNKGIKESQATMAVLGISYDHLGKAIAKEWQLPDVIVNSMQRLPDGSVAEAKTSDDRITHLACFSNELCEIGMNGKDSNEDAITGLVERYGKSIGIKKKQVQSLIDSSKKEMMEFTRAININVSDVSIFPETNPSQESTASKDSTYVTTEIPAATGSNNEADNGIQHNTGHVADTAIDTKDALVRGIAEITDVMLSDFNLNDVLTMILENIYSGMGFTRVLFCIYDRKNSQIVGRFGLGKQIEEIATRFRGRIESGNDIVSSAVTKGKDFIVLDSNSDEYKDRIPPWLRKLTAPQTVVVYPLILNKRCIGLIYADTDDAATSISTEALGFFKTLRNQASMAIRQSQMG